MKTIILSLFILMAVSTQAKNSNHVTQPINGKVNEIVNGVEQPVALAFVFVENTDICTYTEEDGSFKLELPKGKFEVKVVFKGYQSTSKTVKVGKIDNMNFVMVPSKTEMVKK